MMRNQFGDYSYVCEVAINTLKEIILCIYLAGLKHKRPRTGCSQAAIGSHCHVVRVVHLYGWLICPRQCIISVGR